MSVVRTIVFPALRLLVWAVIAVALVVLAFRGGDPAGEATGPGAPTVELTSPAVPVARGAVSNTVSVTGTVVADAAVPLKATTAGTVRKVLVAAGSPVTAGQAVLEIRYEEELDPVTGTDAEGNPTSTPRPPRVRTATVPAPASGTLSAVDVLVDQVVAVGDRVGSISPGTLSVTATLTQADQFRLLAPPSTAEVEVQGGPAPFTCTGLALGGTSTDEGSTPDDGVVPQVPSSPGGGGTTARCQVPAGTTVFPGMGATVRIEAGHAEDVLVVPVTAVQGSVQKGNVWVVAADGAQEQRAVTLGLSDGEQVEIREGLSEGEQVLQFVPVPDDDRRGPDDGRAVRMTLIEMSGISREVRLPDESVLPILTGVDLSVAPGEHVSIVGRSGSGKSTLLNLLGLLDTPTSGTYLLDGEPTDALRARRRSRLRGEVFGFVFQQFNLLPRRTAAENVAAPLLYARGREYLTRRRAAREMLDLVGLGSRADQVPERLSGGEQQRVAIARALVRSPRVVLADEPTGALDVETGAQVMALLARATAENGAALVTITHDLSVAALASRQYRLAGGRLSPLVEAGALGAATADRSNT